MVLRIGAKMEGDFLMYSETIRRVAPVDRARNICSTQHYTSQKVKDRQYTQANTHVCNISNIARPFHDSFQESGSDQNKGCL